MVCVVPGGSGSTAEAADDDGSPRRQEAARQGNATLHYLHSDSTVLRLRVKG